MFRNRCLVLLGVEQRLVEKAPAAVLPRLNSGDSGLILLHTDDLDDFIKASA